MSSRQARIRDVANKIIAFGDDPQADEIIRRQTGYSNALIDALRDDIKHGRFKLEEDK